LYREAVTRPSPTVHAVRDDALGEDDACALRARLAAREVSPHELVQASVARAREVNDALNAVAAWVERGSVPSDVGRDGAFSGIPTVLKDNEDLAGYPTTQGSRAVRDTVAAQHTPAVAHMLQLGLVPLAKTTLPEFGLTAVTESSRFGATRNPYHPGHTPGGSSGGTAALVAAGVVPIGHANDGGGSIRIPASCCGLVGLKPTRGRLPDRPELRRLPIGITTQGVLTRSVRDTARYYAESERVFRPTNLPAIGQVSGPSAARLRVALVTKAPHGLAMDPEVAEQTVAVAGLLDRLGHGVETIEPPVDERFGPDFLRYWQLLASGLQHAGAAIVGPGFDRTRTEAFTQYLSSRVAVDLPLLPGSLRRLRRLAHRHESVFASYDLVLSPVLAQPPPEVGDLGPSVDPRTQLLRLVQWTTFTPLQNISGSPAISLPLGWSRRGLPIGVQLAAPFGHERRLLEMAYELEQAVGRTPAQRAQGE
jgi:amidase